MLKRLVLFLLLVSPFMFSSVWADEMKEPPIVTINGNVRAYSSVAAQLAGTTKIEGLKIDIHNHVMDKVTKFYEIAQNQSKSYNKNLLNRAIQVDDGITVSFKQENKMIWVGNDEIAIKFDNDRCVIATLIYKN